MRTIRRRLQSKLMSSRVFPILMAVTCLGLHARAVERNSQTSLVANDVVTAAQGGGTRVKVPYGTAAVIDGRIAGTEWEGSAVQQLSDGTAIRLHHDGQHLFVGITAARQGFASVCIAQENAVKVFHASAALGSVSYTRSDQDYVTKETAFEYGMRNPDLTEAARAERSDYMSRHGWVASTFSMGAGVVQEIQFSLTRNSRITGLAIAFFVPSGETGTVVTWPETLANHDGCRNERLVRGHVPPRLRFEPRRWAALTLEPR